MSVLDFAIVLIPFAFVMGMAFRTRRYLRDVTSFCSVGRVCGRYVIAVGDMASLLSIIGLVSFTEVHYRTGFALSFWTTITLPISILISLFGFCTYRFRETRAQSIGEFLELRYSRSFRIFAALLRSIAEMLANMIMPALAARFFIYFLALPSQIEVFGVSFSTFRILMVLILTAAVSIIWMGGSMAIVVTDTIQGFICYPLMALFVVFVLYRFSWSGEILPVMADRCANESFLNPFDISHLRDFNFFYLMLTITVMFLHRASWAGGGGSSTAARSPHEQKMAGLLGTWRSAIGALFYVLIAVAILTVMNHRNYAEQAKRIRDDLTDRVAAEVVHDDAMREAIISEQHSLPPQIQRIGMDPPLSEKENLDMRYLEHAHQLLVAKDAPSGNKLFQEYRTLYHQLMMPVTLRHILPRGLLGLFCLLMILLMVSSDDSRIFSAALTLSQDVFLPLHQKPLAPKAHITMLRLVSLGIGVFFFCGSSFMAQLDYITLYYTMATSMWLGGCGPVVLFGLYGRFGTTAGAWTSLLTGMGMASFGALVQRNWANLVYPLLERWNVVSRVGGVLEAISRPFHPYIVWEMNPTKCPVNSYEWYFITMLTTLLLYILVSKLTSKEPFNLERLLHRGKYAIEGERQIASPWSWQNLYNKLIGITPEYTFTDKVIAWSYVTYSIVYQFGFAFLAVIIWNAVSPWKNSWWGNYFLVVSLVIPGIMAAITAVWFGIGGFRDLRQMFHDLESRKADDLDNGFVEGNMTLSDRAAFARREQPKNDSAHVKNEP